MFKRDCDCLKIARKLTSGVGFVVLTRRLIFLCDSSEYT